MDAIHDKNALNQVQVLNYSNYLGVTDLQFQNAVPNKPKVP
jgi:hypothetical protein